MIKISIFNKFLFYNFQIRSQNKIVLVLGPFLEFVVFNYVIFSISIVQKIFFFYFQPYFMLNIRHGKQSSKFIRVVGQMGLVKKRVVLNEFGQSGCGWVGRVQADPYFHIKKCQIFRENESNQSRKQIAHNTFCFFVLFCCCCCWFFFFFFPLSGHLLLLTIFVTIMHAKGKKQTNKQTNQKT